MTWTPSYERLIRTLRHQGEADRVPLVELGIAVKIKSEVLGRSVQSVKDEVDFALTAGYDYVKLQPVVDMNPAKIFSEGGPKGTNLVGADGTRTWADEHQGVITNEAELERYVFPDVSYIDYSRFEEIRRVLPDGMTVIGQYGDIFTLVWELMGFENFSIALYEDPGLLERLFEKVGNIIYSMFETMVQMDVVKVLWYSDDIAYASGLMLSPPLLRKYFFPWLKRIGELARKHGKPFMYHSDGVLWPVFDDIIASGVDAIHPIEPKAMDIVEVKKRYGHALCVIGNIDLSYTLTRGTVEEVEAEVKEKLRTVAPGGGYCLGSSNSVPEYVRTENFVAMVTSCKKYGTYPIAV